MTDNTGRYTEHRGRYPSRRSSALEPHASASYADRSEREARFLEQLGMALADSDQCARVIQKLDDRIEEFYKFTPLQRPGAQVTVDGG